MVLGNHLATLLPVENVLLAIPLNTHHWKW